MSEESLQDRYFANGACFGCGPRNERGLRIKSYVRDDTVVTTWKPEKFHEAFDGVLSGGVIGTLMDCTSTWTAAYHLMRRAGKDKPPPVVTAEYAITLRRPTPTDGPVEIVARPVEIGADRAVIEAELRAGGNVCATSRGTFVTVKPGHPAYHRW